MSWCVHDLQLDIEVADFNIFFVLVLHGGGDGMTIILEGSLDISFNKGALSDILVSNNSTSE